MSFGNATCTTPMSASRLTRMGTSALIRLSVGIGVSGLPISSVVKWIILYLPGVAAAFLV